MGQHWNNAPLCFTIAQARFNPVLELDNYVPQLQERWRKEGFPDFSKQQQMTITLLSNSDDNNSAKPAIATSYLFRNVADNEVFSLNSESLSFSTTRYDNHEDFFAKFFHGLSLVHELVELSYCARLGLRYVDAVSPKPDDSLQQYLNNEVMGQATKWSSLVHAFSETQATSQDNRITSRVLIREGQLAFPPDLAGISLAMDDKFLQIDGLHALIDNDASCQFDGKRQPFDIHQLKEKMKVLRQLDRDAFRYATTDHANDYWKGE